MPRTFGARDLRRRKTRSDLGKKHKTYRGKKPKGIRRIRFEKRRGNKTHIKLRPFERRRMSIEGWRNWHKNIRLKVKPYVWIMGSVILTPVEDISTKSDIEDWALTAIGYPGQFIIMGMSGTLKNRFKRKWVKMFSIEIKETAIGMRARMTNNFRLFRYFFWDKNQ